MIPVTQPFLPPKEEYMELISGIWENNWLTNHGPFVQKLELKLKERLNIPSLHFVSNGTIALQIAIKSLGIKNEIITTPFSFVATTTSILWENCSPVFVDIDPKTLCIDVDQIEKAITDRTEAILATHVFGIPCDVEKIDRIAQKYQLKVIYDAAHAFNVKYKGKSLLSYGDLSTISFHSTKLFHTVEGGGIINNIGTSQDEIIKQMRSFGFQGEQYNIPGINAKNSEFHAAMGLCNLNYLDCNIEKRKQISRLYDELLGDAYQRPIIPKEVEYNYSYYPIILKSEDELKKFQDKLMKSNIEARRYFYPSINNLPYLNNYLPCPISEDISKRILCLPFYYELKLDEVKRICELIMESEVSHPIYGGRL